MRTVATARHGACGARDAAPRAMDKKDGDALRAHHPLSPVQCAILDRVRTALRSVPEFHRACFEAVQRDNGVSLRMLDWFVTNYAKRLALRIRTPSGDSVVVHDAYRTALAAFRRRNFDPFCRASKRSRTGAVVLSTVTLTGPHRGTVRTCVSQLNFMLWAHQNGVLAYARAHSKVIEADMNRAAAASRERRRRGLPQRRAELSRAPPSMCHTYAGVRTVAIG